MSQNQGSYNVPILRFPGYNNGWENKTLESIVSNISSGKSKNINLDGKYPFYGSTGIVGFSDSYDYSEKCLLIARVGANAGFLYKVSGNYCVTDNTLMINVPKDIDEDYLYYLLIKSNLNKLIYGSGQPLITSGMLKSLFINIPSLPEQQKIASFLTTVDEKLQSLKKKKTLLEQYKKGIMQKIFSQERRFKDDNGKEFPEWEEKTLGDCLNYEQPTEYLVTSTDYDDSYKTPVLTAGKTFILGYTNETNGIFNKRLPVIIFDDFTTAIQFVSFPFKAKSSAMKILIANSEYNIKYLFEAMKNIKYEIGGHERHWISKFSQLEIQCPCFSEQTKIANFLSAIDDKINHCQTQIEKTEMWKKGLLQRMFC